jgi:pyruvate/2-oxoglutarate dehydrogenase complex dihydrolipoamide acyltransferase (E2) component
MIDVHIPKLGMSTVEVDVTKVLIEPGMEIEVGDEIAEIESEKVTMFIEAEVAGVVREVLVHEGETYEVGQLVCRIEPR